MTQIFGEAPGFYLNPKLNPCEIAGDNFGKYKRADLVDSLTDDMTNLKLEFAKQNRYASPVKGLSWMVHGLTGDVRMLGLNFILMLVELFTKFGMLVWLKFTK